MERTDTYSITRDRRRWAKQEKKEGWRGGRKVDDKMGKVQNEERAEERMFGEVDACLSPQAYIHEGHATPRIFSEFVCW